MMAKHPINRLLSIFGVEVRRVRASSPVRNFPEPMQALWHCNIGEPATFTCPLRDCVIFNGFGFGEVSWHPFVEALTEYLSDRGRPYKGSRLERYYNVWQPAHAAEALIGLCDFPSKLTSYPSFIKHIPWLNFSCEERLAQISRILLEENASLGQSELGVADGYGLHGPVSDRKGRLEYKRLTDLLESVEREGFRPDGDHIAVQILKRGEDLRFWIAHGYHRTAVLSALGYASFPATPRMLIDVQYVDHWPQVYQGTWTKDQALAYFNHCFDFDARAWAQARGLTFP